VGRHPAELESAIYYACVEAIQNATKHSGPGVRIALELHENAHALSFKVTDDGPGFDAATSQVGAGVQNMRDRLGALDGRLSIVTAPGDGTVVSGTVPLHADRRPRERRSVINNQP
jgi:signal transduction histidine kinase